MIDSVMDLLFGCRHKRITRPITPVHKPGTKSDDTYVACLECGRRFHYDAIEMRVGAPIAVPKPIYRPLTSPFQVQ